MFEHCHACAVSSFKPQKIGLSLQSRQRNRILGNCSVLCDDIFPENDPFKALETTLKRDSFRLYRKLTGSH